MKRTRLERRTPMPRGGPPKRRTRLRPFGRKKRREKRQGTSYGPLADFVRQIGECQGREDLPGDCGWLPGRRELEVCHAGSKNSGQYDWVRAPTGETVGNLWLGCPVHHDYADANKRSTLDWMRETARENGERFMEATDGD